MARLPRMSRARWRRLIQPPIRQQPQLYWSRLICLPQVKSHAGMYGTAEFANGIRQAILIPRSAVVLRGSLACAYVLDSQGIARLRYLTLGAAQGDLVEVLSGISAGEQLVDDPADRDLAGKRIEVQQ